MLLAEMTDPRRGNPPKPQDLFKELISSQLVPGCLAPVPGGESCTDRPISSHTIAKSRELKQIAEAGHVLAAKTQFSAMLDGGHRGFQRTSLKKASVFPGFCERHDRELFTPIETESWCASNQQHFLLGYRALCREYYAKRLIGEAMLPVLRKYKRVTELLAHDSFAEGTDQDTRRLRDIKRHADSEILSGRYRCWSQYFVLGDAMPVRVSGGFQPEFDFSGDVCFDLLVDESPDMLFVTSHSIAGHVLAVFTWFTESPVLEKFVASFTRLAPRQQRASFAQLCFEHFEHTYLQPSWWSGMDPRYRDAMEKRFSDSMSPTFKRPSTCLCPDPTYQCV